MNSLVAQLRAAAEPTRLRLLALAAEGAFCVVEFTEILDQSQPRLSRHIKLLCDAGLLERSREGANVWLTVPTSGEAGRLVRDLLAHLPSDDPVLAADRRHAARVLAERARVASESFRQKGADWDEVEALGLSAAAVEEALLAVLPPGRLGRLLDIGTGTGRLLELLAGRAESALGIDASRAMVALARTRLNRAGLPHCAVRLMDMYRLPLADASFDVVTVMMVLHHAADPAAMLAEAARVLRPGGLMAVVDLAPHDRPDLVGRLAHRWPGFSDAELEGLFARAGLQADERQIIPGPLTTTISLARRQTILTSAAEAVAA